MIRLIYKQTRPSPDTPWFEKSKEIENIINDAKQSGSIVYENFVLCEDLVTAYYTVVWLDTDTHNNYINDPAFLVWRTDRIVYNSQTGCTTDLISTTEF